MQLPASSTSASANPASAYRVHPLRAMSRFFLSTLPGRTLLGLLVAALAAGGFVWQTRYRGTGWSQTFNLFLWYRRSRGEDLYDPAKAMLLHGNRTLPEVVLTFDDGPHPASRSLILDTLKKYGVKATFFDVGMNMAKRPDLLRRTLEEGHEVANHGYNHFRLDGLTEVERRREINDPDITFFALTGQHLRLLRPPGMRYNSVVLDDTRKRGYVVVSYTTASLDFDPRESADLIAERTLRRTENGSILLLHDYPPTARALPKILETLQARGFRCVTVSEMLSHLPEPIRDEAQKQIQSAP